VEFQSPGTKIGVYASLQQNLALTEGVLVFTNELQDMSILKNGQRQPSLDLRDAAMVSRFYPLSVADLPREFIDRSYSDPVLSQAILRYVLEIPGTPVEEIETTSATASREVQDAILNANWELFQLRVGLWNNKEYKTGTVYRSERLQYFFTQDRYLPVEYTFELSPTNVEGLFVMRSHSESKAGPSIVSSLELYLYRDSGPWNTTYRETLVEPQRQGSGIESVHISLSSPIPPRTE